MHTFLVSGKTVGAVNVLFLAIENFVPTRTSKILKNKGKDQPHAYIRNVTVKGGVLAFIITGIASLWLSFWMSLIFGEKYLEYAWIVLFWGLYIFNGLFSSSFIHWLAGNG